MSSKNVIKEYSNGEITVVWTSGLCQHSGNCVRALGMVFRPKEVPWVKIDMASSDEIVAAVRKCPSRALSIKNDTP